jgi:3-hydroxyacyl-[acyl-carrier-protein] dehydratase
MSENVLWDTKDILDILPHRYPFLLVDKVLEFEPDKRVLAIKGVTANEPFFPGHFPGNPVMPGVLILEAMAQSSAIMALKSPNGMDPGKNIFIVGAKDVKFKKKVVPG